MNQVQIFINIQSFETIDRKEFTLKENISAIREQKTIQENIE